jgi:CHAD domain-containing protein
LRGIDSEARWLSDECGPARDLHVFLTDVMPEVPQPISRVGARLATARLARARKALGGTRFNRFDHSLESFIFAPPSSGRETLTTFAGRALELHHAKVLRRGRHLTRLDAADLHRLRIAVKKLRYAAAVLLPVFRPTGATAYVEATESLQDALGVMNDVAVGKQVLADITGAAEASKGTRRRCERLARHLKDRRRHDQRDLKRAWQAFKEAAPFWGEGSYGDTHH